MKNDVDLEYGPTPDNAEYEHTDIEPTLAAKFAIWLVVSLVASVAIVYGTFWFFEGRQKQANKAAQIFPLAAGQTRVPQGPRLQNQPFKDIYQLREAEREKLTTYGWVDQGTGVVRIPIDDALRIMGERGAAVSSPLTPTGLNQVVQDSSGGRTATRR